MNYVGRPGALQFVARACSASRFLLITFLFPLTTRETARPGAWIGPGHYQENLRRKGRCTTRWEG